MKKLAICGSAFAPHLKETAETTFGVEVYTILSDNPMFPSDSMTTTFGVGRSKTVSIINPPSSNKDSVMLAITDIRSHYEYNWCYHPLLAGHEPIKEEFNWVVVIGGTKHSRNVSEFLTANSAAKDWKVVQLGELLLVFFKGTDSVADYELAKTVDMLYLW